MESWKEPVFARIRRDSREEGLSIRALAKRHRVSRRIVRQALASPVPPPRKRPVRTSPTLGPYHELIDAWLRADMNAPVKQRHTARRITDRLAEEHGCKATYGAVRSYIYRRRPELHLERQQEQSARHGFLDRSRRPGEDAEVDFGELWVDLSGGRRELTRCHLFVFRLSFSGRAVHRIYPTCAQEAFLDGHVHALRVLGGVPTGQVRYDNLTAAVERVLRPGRGRVENPRWRAFHEHYGFRPWYCEPGLRGAHEKGGVEGEVGYFRRNYLVPVPVVADLAELNALIPRWEERELRRRIGSREHTVGEDFALEAPMLAPLPEDAFDVRHPLEARVDRYATVTVRTNRYSVPARLIGARVRVMAGGLDLVIYQGRAEVARHLRLSGSGGRSLVLDHYLEILLGKPGALQRADALAQARRQGVFTREHEQLWEKARIALGDDEGTRTLVEVLLLHRRMDRTDVLAGIRAALALDSTDPDLIALESRKAAAFHGRSPTVTAPGTLDGADRPVPERRRRRPDLPSDTRPAPSLSAYDQLLQHRQREEP
ncbi:IS21 family transposase [Streptomyces sp. NPDC004539]|uniref:IS21 family transposase n=1 Tax=Streptomyces sp. NPDC004539 TaxID=3154280 RepID=UPI0033B01E87